MVRDTVIRSYRGPGPEPARSSVPIFSRLPGTMKQRLAAQRRAHGLQPAPLVGPAVPSPLQRPLAVPCLGSWEGGAADSRQRLACVQNTRCVGRCSTGIACGTIPVRWESAKAESSLCHFSSQRQLYPVSGAVRLCPSGCQVCLLPKYSINN